MAKLYIPKVLKLETPSKTLVSLSNCNQGCDIVPGRYIIICTYVRIFVHTSINNIDVGNGMRLMVIKFCVRIQGLDGSGRALTLFKPGYFDDRDSRGGPRWPPLSISKTTVASVLKLCRYFLPIKTRKNTKFRTFNFARPRAARKNRRKLRAKITETNFIF